MRLSRFSKGTQLVRAFEEGVNEAVGSFLTRGKTAERITSTEAAETVLGLRGTSNVRPDRVATIEVLEDVQAAIGFIKDGAEKAIQIVVGRADRRKLIEIEELRRTIE